MESQCGLGGEWWVRGEPLQGGSIVRNIHLALAATDLVTPETGDSVPVYALTSLSIIQH